MKLSITAKQTQTIAPNIIQSMNILQMGICELSEFLDDCASENPALDLASPEVSAPKSDLPERLEWLKRQQKDDPRSWQAEISDSEEKSPFDYYVSEKTETLHEHLSQQIDFGKHTAKEQKIIRYLLTELDGDGYIREDIIKIAEHLSVTESAVSSALSVIQGLEPVGVAARDLAECLTLQLKSQSDAKLAQRIVSEHLKDLADNKYNRISKLTGANRSEIQEACELIKSLNPRPGSVFSQGDKSSYIIPDFNIVVTDEDIELIPNRNYLPRISVNDYYLDLLRSSEDKELTQYLGDKIRQVHQLMYNIENRQSSLLKCVQHIVAKQEAFFYRGSGHLKPLRLCDIAEDLDIHESTVSRAIKDKYIQCRYGTFSLSFFFQRSLGASEGDVSSDKIKTLIMSYVESENKSKPFSDQEISEKLKSEGIQISRRTVAKYRSELGIASTAGRRKF